MERIWNVFYWLQGRLWLIPAIMSLAALGLAYVLLGPGVDLFEDYTGSWWLYSGDAGTARDLLSTLLAGMITMTSLVVSITVVVLSLAANQLGPRLIYNFIEDRRIQVVIGLFVATILYTLLALRTIGEELGGDAAVPHVVVTVASVLTISCLFALLFHVNLIAHSIVADTIVRDVAQSLDAAVGRLPPRLPDRGEVTNSAWQHRCANSIGKSGYVQLVDHEGLCNLASDHDLQIVLDVRAGHFVLAHSAHFEVRAHQPVSDDILGAIAGMVIVGAGRTPTQDLEFSVRQLVEIALRALSPSLNDPFTAIAVIDRLAAALESLSGRALPPREHRDEDGQVRLIADATDFEGLVDAAFNQIRQSAVSSASVLIGLAHRLADLLQIVTSQDQKDAVAKHLKMIERAAYAIAEPNDRDRLLGLIATATSGKGYQA